MTTVTLSDIRQAMSVIGPSVANRSTMPILENVLVERVDGHLRIQATNLKTSASIMIPARGEGEQVRITVPFQKLSGYVSAWPESEMRFTVEGDVMKIRGRSRPQIKGLDPDTFPLVPTEIPEGLPVTTVDAQELREMVSKSTIPTSNEFERPVASSIHIRACGDILQFDSTDTNANASLGELRTSGIEGDHEASLYASLLLGIVKGLQGEVRIGFDQGQVLFATETTVASIQKVDVNYPPLREIISLNSRISVILNREAFLGALQRARLMIDGLFVTLNFTQGNLNVSVPSSEAGSFNEDLACNADQDFSINLHAEYLIEATKNLRGESVTLQLNGPKGPAVLTGDPSWHFVTMPFRV